MFRKAASRLASGTTAYVGCVALHNAVSPLHVVWDLDEMLISSERMRSSWRQDQANQILRLTSTECEHVDDDAMHFITKLRPHAARVLTVLHALPGCRQSVSTAASAGYARNVVTLLEEATGSKLFDDVLADQPSRGKELVKFAPLRRGVLVDNHQSCHSPQPRNGMWVPDFDASARVLELSGGTYALGGAYAVRASKQARRARWPLEPRLIGSGAVVGGGTAFDTNGDATSKPRMKTRKTLAALRRRRTEEENDTADFLEVRHKLLVAAFPDDDGKQRRDARIRELAARAKASGGAALLVVDPNSAKAARVREDVDFPVVTAGAAVAMAVANPHARNHDPRTTVTAADLVRPRDDVLLAVLYRLLVCWLVPFDVRWVLPGVEHRSGSAPAAGRDHSGGFK